MMLSTSFLKKTFLILLSGFSAFFFVHADEGMWVPVLLKQNEATMQRMGLQLSAQDIYSPDRASLKDAVVRFGDGCTGEVVSDQGLLFTNHHCGYSWIQYHSSIENDYLTEGFWAAEMSDELPCPGLEVRFLKEMYDVSDSILQQLPQGIDEVSRKDSVTVRSRRLVAKIAAEGFEAEVVPFFSGNQYYIFVYEIYRDIRLVGTPPSNIGKFGGDTDNWMYPRHTGDFSVFRIYADSANRPADYNPANRPYKPQKYLKIDLRGYQENDFTFVIGYPARTQEYLSSHAIEQIARIEDPMRIAARTERLRIIKQAMDSDPRLRIQYSAKAANIANGWKKWMGELKGLDRLDVMESKREFETVFQDWCASVKGRPFTGVLSALEQTYKDREPYRIMEILFQEHTLAPEAVSFAYQFDKLRRIAKGEDTALALQQALEVFREKGEKFFKDYDPRTDRKIFETMLYAEVDDTSRIQILGFDGIDAEKQLDRFYRRSVFTDAGRFADFIGRFKPSSYKTIERDPMFKYAAQVYGQYLNQTRPVIARYDRTIDSLQRLYMKGQMTLKESGDFATIAMVGVRTRIPLSNVSTAELYPDANFTMRVSYGQVKGFRPADAVTYAPYCTLKGIMEKEDPGIYDYVVEEKLKELYRNGDFGDYANAKGEVPVAFIGTNHTTGGNSGSPVFNSEGNLIGINFDRNWEGTMSDLRYDADLCRNIMLDIRYCLFIMDKFAGADRLIEELDIVK